MVLPDARTNAKLDKLPRNWKRKTQPVKLGSFTHKETRHHAYRSMIEDFVTHRRRRIAPNTVVLDLGLETSVFDVASFARLIHADVILELGELNRLFICNPLVVLMEKYSFVTPYGVS